MTNERLQPNPLRAGLSARAMPQPCTVVIFGASGDLTFRKLIPALYNIAADGDLPAGLTVVGFARRDEVEGAWRFVDSIEEAWHASECQPPLYDYPAGSWGPRTADELLERDGRAWRRL